MTHVGKRPVFGIVQGRLLRPPPGVLQWFPQADWEAEYYMAPAVGLDFIEIIAERQHNEGNPIWSDAGAARIRAVAAENGLIVPTFTNDYIIDHALLGDADVMRLNLRLIECGARLGCTTYIFPLFEQSEMTASNAARFQGVLRETADACLANGVQLCLETVVPGEPMMEALAALDRPDIGVVFDTGNRGALGHDLAGDIRKFGDRVRHVHIKDKLPTGENVRLGTGVVDFQSVFAALADIHYDAMYTFETTRGDHPLRTAAFNVSLVRYHHAETFGT